MPEGVLLRRREDYEELTRLGLAAEEALDEGRMEDFEAAAKEYHRFKATLR
jgi:hypothetical protein